MKRLALGIFAALAFVLTTGCTVTTPATDEVGIVYDAGAFSSTTFQACIDPGRQDISGPGDASYTYPFGQRTFEFADKPDAESKPLGVVTRDNLEMTVSGVATFTLASDCATLRKFHEQLGLKFKAYEDAGWSKMLSIYVGQPLDRAMDAATKSFDWKALFNDPVAKQAWEQKVKELLPGFIKEQGGNAFFGNFNVTLQQPLPPQGVRDALASAQTAKEQNTAQKNANERALTELDLIKKYKEVLGIQGAILWRAVTDGSISIVPVPEGTSLNVSPK